MLSIAVSNGEVILIVAIVSIPLAAIAFLGAGAAYDEIGKGDLSMDHDNPAHGSGAAPPVSQAEQEEEIRQMLEAKSHLREERGEEPLDVEEEMKKLSTPQISPGSDPALVEEVRQLVVARNERRLRQGKEPLDVEEEIQRQLEDLEGLGH